LVRRKIRQTEAKRRKKNSKYTKIHTITHNS